MHLSRTAETLWQILICAAMPAAIATILYYAPLEISQGSVQKIFYLHLSFVAVMYIALFFGLVFGLVHLLAKPGNEISGVPTKIWSDAMGVAFVEVGYLFTTGVLLSGSIWAKPVWGAWWTWDARLTTTLLIWLIYSSYMLVRLYFGDSKQGKTWSAALAVVGFLDVPLIHYSVTLFRGVHPKVITEGGMDPRMLWTLLVSLTAFLLLGGYLVYLRAQTLLLAERIRRATTWN